MPRSKKAEVLQRLRDAKRNGDAADIAAARLAALRDATLGTQRDALVELLSRAPPGRPTELLKALLVHVKARLRATSGGSTSKAAVAAFATLYIAEDGGDDETIALARLAALRYETPAVQRDALVELLRRAPPGRPTELLKALLMHVKARLRGKPKAGTAAFVALYAAQDGGDDETIALARLAALRYESPSVQRDALVELLSRAPPGRPTELLKALLVKVEAPLRARRKSTAPYRPHVGPRAAGVAIARTAALEALNAARTSGNAADIAAARLAALRYATPATQRDALVELLSRAPPGRPAELLKALLVQVKARLRARRNASKAAVATFVALYAAQDGGNDETIALARLAALRYEAQGVQRDALVELLSRAPPGRPTELLKALLLKVEVRLRSKADRENTYYRKGLHRRLRASVPENNVPDLPAYITVARCMDLAFIDDKVTWARDNVPEGYEAPRFYGGITQLEVDVEVARVNQRRYIREQLGDGAILLQGVQIFEEPNRALASLREWALQVHLAKTNRGASIFKKFAPGICTREGVPVIGYLAIAYVRNDRPTSCPLPPIEDEAIWKSKIAVQGARKTPPAWSEDDLDLWLERDAAEARTRGVRVQYGVYCISTRGCHVRFIYSTTLAALREGIVYSTDEVCKDVAEAHAVALKAKAKKEGEYEVAPWTPFTPTEVLYTWGGGDDDEAPSPDDDDDDGAAAPDADAPAAPPRPAPRPLARMRRLPISILPLRSNCRRAEPSRTPPFSWETRAAPSAVRLRPPPLAKMKRKGISLMPLGPSKRRRADAAELARAPPSWPAPLSFVLPPTPPRPLAKMKRKGISLMPLGPSKWRRAELPPAPTFWSSRAAPSAVMPPPPPPLAMMWRRAELPPAPTFWSARAAPSAVMPPPPPRPLAKMKRKGISLMPLGPSKWRRVDAPPSWS